MSDQPPAETQPQSPAPSPAPKPRPRRRRLVWLWVPLLLALVLAGGAAIGIVRYNAPGPLAEEKTLVVPPGGVRAIARQLAQAGILGDPWTFEFGIRLERHAGKLKAGEYSFPAHISPAEVGRLLESGKIVLHKLTIPEGLTSAEIVALVEAADPLAGKIGVAAPEGGLMPDTYYFDRGDSRDSLILRMREAMDQVLAREWAGRAANLPLASPQEALTLASIVEKETALSGERPHIAAVFLNRLRLGMKLQSDPTVIYGRGGIADPKAPLSPLTKADLAEATPYNTYVIEGLPPGPIANPGLRALDAVLHPDASEDLYFVADGSGGHAFAKTLDEHNKNVARWRKLQDKPAADPKSENP